MSFRYRSMSTILVLILLLLPFPVHALDHSAYDEILNRYVKGGYFDYESFVKNSDDRNKLHDYLSSLSNVEPKELSENEELAYWMNLYNASTIDLVTRNYPLESIRDLDGWFGSIFSKKFIPVGDRKLSLDNVEHDTIRERFDEPRIHFALVCAARSCPPLRDEAYVGERLDEQLEDQTRIFLQSDKNQFPVQNGQLKLKFSKILYWYGEDFGGESGVVQFVKNSLPQSKQSLIERENYSVEYFPYDWSLNQAPGPYGFE